jgi:hypothetical protein
LVHLQHFFSIFWIMYSVYVFWVRVRVTLHLAVCRQSVRLGAGNFFSQMNACGHSPYITSSLTRGLVCHLQLLLVLANAFILGSESRGTRDHILLSQIRDFSFCRLLRLSGLRWRYSTPPPHGKCLLSLVESCVTTDGQSASLSWNKAPIWSLRPDFYYCQTVAGLLIWGALSDEMTDLSFTIAAGPR